MSAPSQTYRYRIIDDQLTEYLQTFGAVSVEGPKWCGKTTTCLQQANTTVEVTDPAGNYAVRTLARIDPNQLFAGTPPILLDEWQAAPGIWDAVRHNVDRNHARGKFLLCGSAVPTHGTTHSGTGRIARLRMHTMTLFESGLSSGSVSLQQLMNGAPAVGMTQGVHTLDDVIEAICRGGWPETINDPLKRAMLVPRQYVESVCNRPADTTNIDLTGNENNNFATEAHQASDSPTEIDESNVDPDRMRALFRAVARSTASPVKKNTLLQDTDDNYRPANKRNVATSYQTLNRYYQILRQLYLIDEQPAWAPALRSPVRLRAKPKLHLTDPSLAVASLGATPQTLKGDFKTLGLLFESMVYRDLNVYASSFDARVYHYLDNSDLEADAIVELDNGAWGAFEVKLSPDKIDTAAESLNRLEAKMIASGQEGPRCKCVIVGTFNTAYTRPDGVRVVPVGALRP